MVSTTVLFPNMTEMRARHKRRRERRIFLRLSLAAPAANLPRRRRAARQEAVAEVTRDASMNFASDNGAGVAPEILEAIVASSRVNAPAYGADDYTRARRGEAQRDFRDARSPPSSSPPARRPTRWRSPRWSTLGRDFLPRGGACPRRRMRRAGVLHRRRQAGRHPGDGGKITPDALARDAGALSARARQVGRSRARCRCRRRPKPGRSTASTRSRRSSAIAHAARRRRAYGRRALRQCAGRAGRRAGRHDLAGGRRRAVASARPRTARSPARRSSFSIRRGRRISPTSASAAARRCRRAGFLGAQMEAYLADGLWLRLAASAPTIRRGGSASGWRAIPGVRARLADRGQRGLRRRARCARRALARGRRELL